MLLVAASFLSVGRAAPVPVSVDEGPEGGPAIVFDVSAGGRHTLQFAGCRRRTVLLESNLDDTNLRDPHRCFPGKIHGFFTKKIVVANKGPVPVRDLYLTVNGRDFRGFAPLKAYLSSLDSHVSLLT